MSNECTEGENCSEWPDRSPKGADKCRGLESVTRFVKRWKQGAERQADWERESFKTESPKSAKVKPKRGSSMFPSPEAA
jgi:hypothetical protein